jgi:hypothetical protein
VKRTTITALAHDHAFVDLSMKTLEEELKEVLSRGIAKLPVVKDFPRLASRMVVEVCAAEFGASTSCASPSLKRATPGSPSLPPSPLSTTRLSSSSDSVQIDHVQEMKRVACAIAGQLEGREQAAKVDAFFATVAPREDPEAVARRLVLGVLGGDTSPTARLLKAANQTVLSPAVWAIRSRLPVVAATKDWAGPDGWRINVRFMRDAVAVNHVRREQGTNWWFEWQMTVVFGRSVEELQSARVRVSALHFEDTIDPELRMSLNRSLCHGALNLC